MLKLEKQQVEKEAIKVKSKEELISFLASNYMELYYIHPFREGNSRTLREFLREYVELMNKFIITFGNYEIEYSALNDKDRENFIRATIWNTSKDQEKQKNSIKLLENIFNKCLVEIQKTK